MEQRPSSFPALSGALISALVLVVFACCHSSSPAPLRQEVSIEPDLEVVSTGDPDKDHARLFAEKRYPAATDCKPCHEEHYEEWACSPHAYAQVSPIFNAMYRTVNALTGGTNGDFCIRCHTPVGMALDEDPHMDNEDRAPVSFEGVTCVVCHRVDTAWGKESARVPLAEGDIHSPVFGPVGNDRLADVLGNPDDYGPLKTEPGKGRAREVHGEARKFFALAESSMCGTCHDVLGPNGFRLEDAFSEYKSSPAAARGESCQDCHMGKEHGKVSGYREAPAAVVGGVASKPRRRTNHMFPGPDYSVVHPGIFPHHPDSRKLAKLNEWPSFDYKAGWGTEAFEADQPETSDSFPAPWNDQARRVAARAVVDRNLKLLEKARQARREVLSVGYQIGDIIIDRADAEGIDYRVLVFNGTDGHGVPTGFDAERLVWVRTEVTDGTGKRVHISGKLDPNGDLLDDHSVYVHAGAIPVDEQLFSLQSKFIVRTILGGEREQILPVPYSIDPLPYIRPETAPFTVLGRPLAARKHKQNIPVGGSRWARYHVPAEALTGAGEYKIDVKLKTGMVPVNLVERISKVGFHYGMSTREVANELVGGHLTLHSRQATTEIR